MGKFVAVGYIMSGRFVPYLLLLAPERAIGMPIVAGTPSSAMAPPEEAIGDWAAHGGSSARLQQIEGRRSFVPTLTVRSFLVLTAGIAEWFVASGTAGYSIVRGMIAIRLPARSICRGILAAATRITR
jgi:hypothetical protein